MTKILLLLSLSDLAGCLRAENYDIFGFRNDIFVMADGYRIKFYEQEETLLESKMVEETNFKFNEAQTVDKGYSVLSSKLYRKDIYAQAWVRPNKNGVLSSPGLPCKFSAQEKYHLIGQIEIDGVIYRLVPDQIDNFAFLIDEDGKFYGRGGQIKGNYFILTEGEFFPYPKDLRMEEVNVSRAEQSKPVQGFDVKYDGVRLDRIWFTYLDYEGSDTGRFENISFPNKPGLITINGINMRVLQADDQKITYMLLK